MIWFETGDLFVHFNWNLHPTGIQRVGIEILRAAQTEFGDRIAFCRLSRHSGRLEPIDFARILAASAGPEFGEPTRGRLHQARTVLRQLRRFLERYPKTVLTDRLRGRRAEREFARRVKPGDALVCLGLPWGSPAYGAWIAAAKRRYGLGFALLVHDVIPFTNPELCQGRFAAGFRRWFGNVLPACDVLFVSSEFCRGAIAELCAQRGWLAPPIERIPFGAGFRDEPPGGEEGTPAGGAIAWPERFVLFVSSIDRRKNHDLLLRVWRKLAERHGVAAMPALVFLGVGGEVGTVSARIAAEPLLRGKVTMIRGASDAVLREAYRRCLFTVYPSLTEGWGLPVAESLDFGKFCVVSNRASLPEVGGGLVDYIDPEDDAVAVAVFERVLFEPGYLAARTARIATEYRAPSWRNCAAAVIARAERLADAVPAALRPKRGAAAAPASFDAGDIEADVARELACQRAEADAAMDLAAGLRLDQIAAFGGDDLIRLGYAALHGRPPSIAEINRDRLKLAAGLTARDFLDGLRELAAAGGHSRRVRRRGFGWRFGLG